MIDNIEEHWEDENVLIFTNLDDIGDPYTCEQWANAGSHTNNIITQDEALTSMVESYNFYEAFGSNIYQSHIFIDHNMNVFYKDAGEKNENYFNGKINQMLNSCGDLCVHCTEMLGDITSDENLDLFDVVALRKYLNEPDLYHLADCELNNANINQNATVNILDLYEILALILVEE